jgi:hypothetical protein
MPYTKAQLALFHMAAKGKSRKMGMATGKKLVAESRGMKAKRPMPKHQKMMR